MSEKKGKTTLIQDLEVLRAYPAKWKGLYDPLKDLQDIREGEDQSESSFHFYNCEKCGFEANCPEYTKLVVKEQTDLLREPLETALRQRNMATHEVELVRKDAKYAWEVAGMMVSAFDVRPEGEPTDITEATREAALNCAREDVHEYWLRGCECHGCMKYGWQRHGLTWEQDQTETPDTDVATEPARR